MKDRGALTEPMFYVLKRMAGCGLGPERSIPCWGNFKTST